MHLGGINSELWKKNTFPSLLDIIASLYLTILTLYIAIARKIGQNLWWKAAYIDYSVRILIKYVASLYGATTKI